MADRCLDASRQGNAWNECVGRLSFQGASVAGRRWKSPVVVKRRSRAVCLSGLLESFGLKKDGKEAVAGRLLSEMLVEVSEVD